MVPQAHCAAFLSGSSIVRQVGRKTACARFQFRHPSHFQRGFMGRKSTGPPLLSFSASHCRPGFPFDGPRAGCGQHHHQKSFSYSVSPVRRYTQSEGDFSVKPQFSLFPLPARLSIRSGKRYPPQIPFRFSSPKPPGIRAGTPGILLRRRREKPRGRMFLPQQLPSSRALCTTVTPCGANPSSGRERQCPFRAGAFPGRRQSVLRPMTTTWPRVFSLKYFRSSGIWARAFPLFPDSPVLVYSHNRLHIALLKWQPGFFNAGGTLVILQSHAVHRHVIKIPNRRVSRKTGAG